MYDPIRGEKNRQFSVENDFETGAYRSIGHTEPTHSTAEQNTVLSTHHNPYLYRVYMNCLLLSKWQLWISQTIASLTTTCC